MRRKAAHKKSSKQKSLAQTEVSLTHSHPIYFLLFLAVVAVATVVVVSAVVTEKINEEMAGAEFSSVIRIAPRPSMMMVKPTSMMNGKSY